MVHAIAPVNAPLKILIVDDHALVRSGLAHLLQGLADSVTVLEAPTCAQAGQLAKSHPDIDLVLLDYAMPDMNGLDMLQLLGKHHPELPVILLSGIASPLAQRKAIDLGAAAFIMKSARSEELMHAVKAVLAGQDFTPVSHEIGIRAATVPRLTKRQEEVLALLNQGISNKLIGKHLNLSDETVKNHITAILRAFNVKNRTQAVLAASQFGYTDKVLL